MLGVKGAAALRATCRALRQAVHECPLDLGSVPVSKLSEALTCFPRARSLMLAKGAQEQPTQELCAAAVEGLRGRGQSLRAVSCSCPEIHKVVSRALRAGHLPNLKSVKLWIAEDEPEDAALLTEGLLKGVEVMFLYLYPPMGAHAAALGQLPGCRSLTKLVLVPNGEETLGEHASLAFPAGLRALSFVLKGLEPEHQGGFLRGIPARLEAGGVTLTSLDLARVALYQGAAEIGDLLSHCSGSLTSLVLIVGRVGSSAACLPSADALRSVAAGLASCARLEFLAVPSEVFTTIAPRTVFSHLRGLEVTQPGRSHCGGLMSTALLGLMARGAFPALTWLKVLQSREDGPCITTAIGTAGDALLDEVLMPAFEGVASTLREFTWSVDAMCASWSPRIERRIGVAIGRLRELRVLVLNTRWAGSPCRLLLQGVAAGCPRLDELVLILSRYPHGLPTGPSAVAPSVQPRAQGAH
jgi:hypothetical protein